MSECKHCNGEGRYAVADHWQAWLGGRDLWVDRWYPCRHCEGTGVERKDEADERAPE